MQSSWTERSNFLLLLSWRVLGQFSLTGPLSVTLFLAFALAQHRDCRFIMERVRVIAINHLISLVVFMGYIMCQCRFHCANVRGRGRT